MNSALRSWKVWVGLNSNFSAIDAVQNAKKLPVRREQASDRLLFLSTYAPASFIDFLPDKERRSTWGRFVRHVRLFCAQNGVSEKCFQYTFPATQSTRISVFDPYDTVFGSEWSSETRTYIFWVCTLTHMPQHCFSATPEVVKAWLAQVSDSKLFLVSLSYVLDCPDILEEEYSAIERWILSYVAQEGTKKGYAVAWVCEQDGRQNAVWRKSNTYHWRVFLQTKTIQVFEKEVCIFETTLFDNFIEEFEHHIRHE